MLPPANGDAAKACRPFDADRTGMVLGEGAGIVILEELSAAEKRGATIFGEVIGHGSSAVANPQGVADYQAAFENVIAAGLATAGLEAGDIGHVHAHGVGSLKCDAMESAAINQCFGSTTPVTAAKSYMGNLGAGSGVVELIASLLAMQAGQLFPSLNCDQFDPQCQPINLVTDDSVAAGNSVLSMNITPQGQASAIVVRTV